VLKLVYGAVIRTADLWRGIALGELEQWQLKAIRGERGRSGVRLHCSLRTDYPGGEPVGIRPREEVPRGRPPEQLILLCLVGLRTDVQTAFAEQSRRLCSTRHL
jgi:hypothetical protein